MTYRGATVKSIVVAALSLAIGADAHVAPGKSLEIGGTSVSLDRDNQIQLRFPQTDNVKYIPMVDFVLKKDLPDLANRVVILGYDGHGPDDTLQTSIGRISHGRFLYYELRSVYNDWCAERKLSPPASKIREIKGERK